MIIVVIVAMALRRRRDRTRTEVSGTRERAESRGIAWMIGAFVICPCHLPVTMALATSLLAGTAAGAALRGHPLAAGTAITLAWLAASWHGVRLLRKPAARWGMLAVGGLACGLFAVGGASIGLLLAVGGAAVGLGVSVGGFAVGSIAIGGVAVGFDYAIGGGAFGPAVIDGRHCDDSARDFVRRWLSAFQRMCR